MIRKIIKEETVKRRKLFAQIKLHLVENIFFTRNIQRKINQKYFTKDIL